MSPDQHVQQQHAVEHGFDRRDELRRRIYLALLGVGMPAVVAMWATHLRSDPFIAFVYPACVLHQSYVFVRLAQRRMRVRRAERLVLAGIAITYLGQLAVGLLTASDLAELRAQTTVSSLLTINLMAMLAYVAFDTRQALRVASGIVGTYTVIVSVRLIPEAVAGSLGAEATEYVSILMFLIASVGILHVLAQVKEQAAEARSSAAAMRTLAHTDALTGIPNRRHLHEALGAQLTRPDAADPLTVILLDLDHFKRVNDTHGHDVGDEVLRTVAATLTGIVRASDLVGRWGGEEFLLIAPDTVPAQATELAERIRLAVAAAAPPEVGPVTASLGIATQRADDDARTLLCRADDALYRAKAAGRDRYHSDADGRPHLLTG